MVLESVAGEETGAHTDDRFHGISARLFVEENDITVYKVYCVARTNSSAPPQHVVLHGGVDGAPGVFTRFFCTCAYAPRYAPVPPTRTSACTSSRHNRLQKKSNAARNARRHGVPCRHFLQVFKRVPGATLNVGMVHPNYHKVAPPLKATYPLLRSPAFGLQQGPLLVIPVTHPEPLEVNLPPMDSDGKRLATMVHANMFAIAKQLAGGESSYVVWMSAITKQNRSETKSDRRGPHSCAVVLEGSAGLQGRAMAEFQRLIAIYEREVKMEKEGPAGLITEPTTKTQPGSSAYAMAQGRGRSGSKKKGTNSAAAVGGGGVQTEPTEDEVLEKYNFKFVNDVVSHKFSHTQRKKKTAVVAAVQVCTHSWVNEYLPNSKLTLSRVLVVFRTGRSRRSWRGRAAGRRSGAGRSGRDGPSW